MEHQNPAYLAEEKLGRLMRGYAVPCVVSLLVGALYNIVDQIFIANADYLGSYGNAANTVVFPLTVIALAVAVMIGDGFLRFCQPEPRTGQRPRRRTQHGKRGAADRPFGRAAGRRVSAVP